MDSRQPELSRLTLMCSDHEVAEFTWNHDRQAVTGKTHVLDAAHAPLMATDPSGNITRDRLSSWFKNRGIPDFRPDARGPPSRRRLPVGRLPHGLWFRRIAVRPILDPPRRIRIHMARRKLLRERFQRRARRAASSARRLVGPLPHREDQGQRRPPRLIARCGPERQPAETLDDRGRAADAGQVRAILRQVPGTVQREDRQRPVLAAARRGRLCRLRARGRRLHEVDLPLQTHDRPGHRVRAGLGAALLVETPLGPRAARFLRVRLRRPRARRARGRGEDARHRLPHGELR